MVKQIPTFKLINLFSLDTSIYGILKIQKIDLVFKLWEIVVCNNSLMVLADSPDICRWIY